MALLPLLQSTAGSLSRTNFTDVVINETWNPQGYGPIAVYALLISMFVVALAYMIAEFLHSPQLNAWAKSELQEFIVSALLVGNLFFGLTLMNTVVFDLTGGLDHFGVANDYLNQLIKAPSVANIVSGTIDWADPSGADLNEHVGDLNESYMALWGIEMLSGVLGTVQFAFIISSGPALAFLRLGLAPFAGLAQITPSILSMLDMIGVIIMAFVAQKALLSFFQQTMFKLFLPLGVALRAFPITRKLGATMIALAITCYVVYPLTLAMDLGIYDSIQKPPITAQLVDWSVLLTNMGADKVGDDCKTRAACGGAICDCAGAACDCNTNSCTCRSCPSIGTDCTFDSECCGTCQHDPTDPDPNHKTCQISPFDILYKGAYNFSSPQYPECATPDPQICDPLNADPCPCARASGVTDPCVKYPDNNYRCKTPVLGQGDVTNLLETQTGNNCPWYMVKCWSVFGYEKAVRINSKISWVDEVLVAVFASPLIIPEIVFYALSAVLPNTLWSPVVATALAIVDLIICVTFFRSISESIGGDPTIWGLSKAV